VTDQPSSRAIRDFLGEAEEIIEKLNHDLLLLADSADKGANDPELVNSIFRGAHSIKGLSGMFGFDDISELAHHAENLLDSMRLGKVPLSPSLVEILFGTVETLSWLVHGKGETEDFTLDVTPAVERIENFLSNSSSKGGDVTSAIDPAILNVLTEYEEHRLQENLRQGRRLLRVRVAFLLTSFDQDLAELTGALKDFGEVISTLPCPGDFSDRIDFQLVLGTELSVAGLQAQIQRDDVVIEYIGGAINDKETSSLPDQEQERTLLTEAAMDAGEMTGGSLRSISRTVRVDIDKLDSLMNIVGELVLAKGAIAGIAENLRNKGAGEQAMELQKATRILDRRLEDLQKGVMEVRMVPVGQLFEKLIRIVRRVAAEQGKKVTLDIRGTDTELDKLIVEDLSDPLMHIIRNAIDHGLEPPDERRAAGKPEKGTICLWAAQRGNHVVLEVRDDGRGIDPQKVRRKALQKGLISEETELTSDDLTRLIFSPGFSTRDDVTDLSGRGVGMDVVQKNIAALSGMIGIDSVVGEGTTLTITLPITLAIIKALIVRICGRIFAIPINSVLETLMIDGKDIRTIERREVMDLRQSTLPLLRVGEVFQLPPATASGRLFVVVVGMADKKMGMVVDDLLGQQDVVIKSLGDVLSAVRGIAGAADLGNQRTILVLDVGGLMMESYRGDAIGYV
jgi:two-component system, chemotaxis family, sensor kinase CheA